MANSSILNLLKKRGIKGKIETKDTINAAIPVVENKTLQTWLKEVDRLIKKGLANSVTKSDLKDLGIISENNDGLISLVPKEEVKDLTTPIAVFNLKASSAYSSVNLNWETKKSKLFGHNAVYRAHVDDFGQSVQIGTTIGDIYVDHVGNNINAFYWVRTISRFGVEGDLSKSVEAQTAIDVAYILEQLKEKITTSQFTKSLVTEIARIEENSKAIAQEALNRASAIHDKATEITLELKDLLDIETLDRKTAITHEQTVRQEQFESLSQEINQIGAGSGEQFDSGVIWFFDNDAEGWSCTDGEPLTDGGQIRPSQITSSNYLLSPDNTDIDGKVYPILRLRIIKHGSPVWDAQMLNNGNEHILDEPIWDINSSGIINKNIGWSGTIGQIQLLFTKNTEDEANYYSVDWIAIGRPSPSASHASLYKEQQARISGDSANARELESISATANSNNNALKALIQKETEARVEGDSSLAREVTHLKAEVSPLMAGSEDDLAGDSYVSAGIYTAHEALADGDEALSKKIDLVYADMSGEFGSIEAKILEESQARVTEDSALSEQIKTLSIQVNDDISAAIREEKRIRSEGDSLLGEKIDAMTLKFGEDIAAAILSESTIRASDDGVLSEKVDSMVVKFGQDLAAAISNESTIRAEQDSVLAKNINTLSAQLSEEVVAAIQEERLVRAEQDSALAKAVNSVSTTVGENTASIQEAFTSIDGIKAEWKIQVSAGGKISGVSLGVDGEESAFTVVANRFSVVSPNGEISVPFNIDDAGKAYLDTALIKNASIKMAQIEELSAEHITAGDIHADRMKANIVQAIDGKFENLGAITAKIGHLRTADTGARLEFKGNLLTFYDDDESDMILIGKWLEDPI